jgi:hypothetical protein
VFVKVREGRTTLAYGKKLPGRLTIMLRVRIQTSLQLLLQRFPNYIMPLCNDINSTIYLYSKVNTPVTVAEGSRACTVFTRSEAGIVGSNPTQGMDV